MPLKRLFSRLFKDGGVKIIPIASFPMKWAPDFTRFEARRHLIMGGEPQFQALRGPSRPLTPVLFFGPVFKESNPLKNFAILLST